MLIHSQESKKGFTTFSDVMSAPAVASPVTVSASAAIATSSGRDTPDLSTSTSAGGGGSGNVVIGMAQDTDPKNLVTFCASLRK